jgi:hypothetical protein
MLAHTRKRRKPEPSGTNLEIRAGESVAARQPVDLYLRTALAQQVGECLALLRRDAAAMFAPFENPTAQGRSRR